MVKIITVADYFYNLYQESISFRKISIHSENIFLNKHIPIIIKIFVSVTSPVSSRSKVQEVRFQATRIPRHKISLKSIMNILTL